MIAAVLALGGCGKPPAGATQAASSASTVAPATASDGTTKPSGSTAVVAVEPAATATPTPIPPPDIQGTWTACLPSGNGSLRVRLTFFSSGQSFVEDEDLYHAHGCDKNLESSTQAKGTYAFGATSGAATSLDLIFISPTPRTVHTTVQTSGSTSAIGLFPGSTLTRE